MTASGDETVDEKAELLQQGATHRGSFHAFLARWTPYMEEPEDDGTQQEPRMFYGLSFKPEFLSLHRCVIVVINLAMISSWAIMPFWEHAIGEDPYYMPEEDMCTGPLQTIFGPIRDTCEELKPGFAEENWLVTPVQRHLHRYGNLYQLGIYFHVVMGVWVNVACNTVLALRGFGLCTTLGTWRLFAQCLHYYGFLWCWLAHMAVAMTMAYLKMITMGPEDRNWKNSFKANFFYQFTFVIQVILLSLQRSFHDVGAKGFPGQAFASQVCRCGCIANILCGIFMYFVLLLRPDISAGKDTFYPRGGELVILGAILFIGFVEAVGTTMYAVAFRTNDTRVFSAGTLYFGSDLILSLNVVARFFPGYGGIYAAIGYLCVIGFYGGHMIVNFRSASCRNELSISEAFNLRIEGVPL
eukprot:TRINITY_DN387_c0_g1_i1.p1 TRINITY_DN387_c0_g1~~TRINITY_DN387_c0_g1_i1.p1  ORF type:complete len:412 (+),score=21.73 TRINITY_DN387_c0_g1_i1:178-1413(+)